MRTHKNYRKEIITLEILSRAIVNSMGMKKEEAREYASILLDIFGYNNRLRRVVIHSNFGHFRHQKLMINGLILIE